MSGNTTILPGRRSVVARRGRPAAAMSRNRGILPGGWSPPREERRHVRGRVCPGYREVATGGALVAGLTGVGPSCAVPDVSPQVAGRRGLAAHVPQVSLTV